MKEEIENKIKTERKDLLLINMGNRIGCATFLSQELLVSPEHKVYTSEEERKSLKSFVLNTLTEDCCLNDGSLDQIAQFNFNANANTGISLPCTSCLAFDSNSLNDSFGIIPTNLDNSDKIILNCDELSFEYFNMSDLIFFNSSTAYSGVNNLIPKNSAFKIIDLTGFSLKNESNTLVSTTNFIFYQPSCLYLFHTLSFILSPSFRQSSSVSLEFSNILSSFLSSKARLTFSDKNLRTASDTFSSGSSSNCSFSSCDIDKVKFGILISPLFSVYSVKDVQVYKSFGLNKSSYEILPNNLKENKSKSGYQRYETPIMLCLKAKSIRIAPPGSSYIKTNNINYINFSENKK